MAFRALIGLLAAWMLFAAPATFAQTPNGRVPVFEDRHKQYLDGLQQYPVLKQHKIAEVFRFRVDEGQLAIEPAIEADREYQERRAELEDLAEPASILCWLISQDLGQVQFEIKLDDLSDPLAWGHLSVQARPSNTDSGKLLENIDIEKNWLTASGFRRRVFFSQANNSARLEYFSTENEGERITLVEKDFATLRRNHHAETERLLRPILKELHQESALAADVAAAWQVLAGDWPVDEKLKPLVAARLGALNHPDFRIRLAAADALQKLGRDGALVIMRMRRGPLTCEQNLRLDEVVSRFQPLSDTDARALYNDLSFLVDCLYCDDAITRKLAMHRLAAITGNPISFDPNAPEDQRVIAVNALRQKLLGGGRK